MAIFAPGLTSCGRRAWPVRNWTARSNKVTRNNTICAVSEERPAFSGIGIFLGGTHDVRIVPNHVRGNRASGASPVSGGIIVATRFATDNLIRKNVAFRNRPFGVWYDGSGARNRFVDNRCGRSNPSWICGLTYRGATSKQPRLSSRTRGLSGRRVSFCCVYRFCI